VSRDSGYLFDLDELEGGTYGESLELAMVEILNMKEDLKDALDGIQLMTAAILSKEIGLDRYRARWPRSISTGEVIGVAWTNTPEEMKDLEPPADPSQGWKLCPKYATKLRYWWGDEWDPMIAGDAINYYEWQKWERGNAETPPSEPMVRPALADRQIGLGPDGLWTKGSAT
jgi:hypothetical protein